MDVNIKVELLSLGIFYVNLEIGIDWDYGWLYFDNNSRELVIF